MGEIEKGIDRVWASYQCFRHSYVWTGTRLQC